MTKEQAEAVRKNLNEFDHLAKQLKKLDDAQAQIADARESAVRVNYLNFHMCGKSAATVGDRGFRIEVGAADHDLHRFAARVGQLTAALIAVEAEAIRRKMAALSVAPAEIAAPPFDSPPTAADDDGKDIPF